VRASFAVAALIVGLARSVAAEPTEADKDAARILFTEAKELRDAGKLAPALERFARAHQLAATPITTVELARTHVMMGHLVEARRLYQSVDAIEKKPGESPKSVAARDEAKQLLTELEPRIPTIVVKITPADPIVAASIDGKAIEPSDLAKPIAVDPGKHVIVVRAKKEATTNVTVAEGEHDRAVPIELPREDVVVTPKPNPLPIAPPPATSGFSSTMRTVGLITGGVGLIVGAGAGVFALSKASSVKDNCAGGICGPSYHDDLDATRRWATVSTVGFGVAALGATLFVIGLTTEPSKKDAARTFVPYAFVTDRGGSLGLEGRF
jgi:hypothetical protein